MNTNEFATEPETKKERRREGEIKYHHRCDLSVSLSLWRVAIAIEGGQMPDEKDGKKEKKKKINMSDAWREAKALVYAHRGRLAFGASLMLINRLVGLVLPASSKYIIDDVIGKGRAEMLAPIAMAAGAATLIQAVTSFALSQVFFFFNDTATTE